MNYYLHSKEIDKINITDDFDIEKLNQYEIMGLYLIGQVSIGKLRELFNTKILETNDFVTKIINIINDNNKNKILCNNITDDIL